MRRATAFGTEDYYYHADDMANVMALTDSLGAVVERVDYTDFGQVLDPATGNVKTTSLVGNPFFFQGRYLDPMTGCYYFRTRYLDPSIGRFTTRDTIGIWGDGANHGNGYVFGWNNPWTMRDPSGQWGVPNWVHTTLDVAGLVPGLGTFPDLINAGLYAAEGDAVGLAGSLAGAVPLAGLATGFGKLGKTMFKSSDEAVGVARNSASKATRGLQLEAGALKAGSRVAGGVPEVIPKMDGGVSFKVSPSKSVGPADAPAAGAKPQKTYQTYTKTNPDTGEVYSGRTSGTGTPEQNLARRDSSHQLNKDEWGFRISCG